MRKLKGLFAASHRLKYCIHNNEELRIVYVACTRPEKLLWVAVPADDIDCWRKKLSCPIWLFGGCYRSGFSIVLNSMSWPHKRAPKMKQVIF